MESASILIVEDEAIVAMDLQGELVAMGYQVAGIADTADDAVEQGLRLRPSLVLMDIVLKGQADGIRAAERLRRELDTPIIFLTSFSDPETVARAARTAAYGYLTKPFQLKELRAGIEVALWKARLERQLRESDRWFASTLRCVHDGIVVVNADGAIRFINSAAESLTGYSSDEAAGRPVDEIVHFANRAEDVPSLIQRALELGRVVGVRHAQLLLNRNSETVPVDESAGPVRDDQGQRMGAVLVLRSATERIRQEALLRASEQRFRSAFDHAPLGMAMVSTDGRFLQVNEALSRLLGCAPEWLLERTQESLTWAEDLSHERARLHELRALGQTMTQFEKRYIRPSDGRQVWVLVNASVLSEDQRQMCYLYQIHDLTAQKAAATQLAELAAERLKREASELAHRSKSEFLSRISHEMRTPLNAVIGFAQLLKLHHSAGEVQDAMYSQHILNAGQHLLALVDDVLDVQRASAGTLSLNMVSVALEEVLPATVDLLMLLAADRGVHLDVALPAGLRMLADVTRLRQVVLNVVSNAIKYNIEGGSVRVTARRVEAGLIRVSVEDSGIGMSDHQLEHLFEPFNRLGREALRIPGVGLGLVITQKLIEQMGGRMSVSRATPQGTVVTLDFVEQGGEVA